MLIKKNSNLNEFGPSPTYTQLLVVPLKRNIVHSIWKYINYVIKHLTVYNFVLMKFGRRNF